MDIRLIATFVTLVLPAVMAFWITIHGCQLWRKAGVIPAYSVAALTMTAAVWFAWHWRERCWGLT